MPTTRPRLHTLALLATLAAALSFGACSAGGHARLDGAAATASRGDVRALRAEIVREAERHVGAKYTYGAKGPRAFDCSGLTSYVYRRSEIALAGSSTSQAIQGLPISAREAEVGDLLYFKSATGRVNHVAIVVATGRDGLEVVHATLAAGVVRENVTHSSYWAPRLAGARRVLEVGGALASIH